MRTLIATVFAAALALSPASALAQETNATNATDPANIAAPEPGTDANLSTAVPPTDNMMATELPPVADPALTADTAMPAEDDRDGGVPWGLLGLLGLVGLLGRRRSS